MGSHLVKHWGDHKIGHMPSISAANTIRYLCLYCAVVVVAVVIIVVIVLVVVAIAASCTSRRGARDLS